MLPAPSKLSENWNLNSDIVFLNHGSFGATPNFVFNKQIEYMTMLEHDPVQFSTKQLYPYYYQSKNRLAQFLGTASDNIYFVPNTTIGINHILHSLTDSGCDWLTTNHAYGACFNAFQKIGIEKGNHIIKMNFPYPLDSDEDIFNAIEKSITPKTRLVMMDYISSSTAIIFPIKKIIEYLHTKNIRVLVDGAHAPGMIDFVIDELQADFFVGNCHKWICSPKGSAFVYVHPQYQKEISPLSTGFINDWEDITNSHYWSNQFIWEGTRDYSTYLSVGDAIDYLPTLVENGWKEIRFHNKQLAWKGAQVISEKLEVKLPIPKEMTGSIVNIPLWDDKIPSKYFNYFTETKNILFEKYRIEVPCFLFPQAPQQYIRISAQLYNSVEQYEYLADCLYEIRKNLV